MLLSYYILFENINDVQALLECDGDSIDLSGDVGAVGRVVIANTSSGDDEMLLDLKGKTKNGNLLLLLGAHF